MLRLVIYSLATGVIRAVVGIPVGRDPQRQVLDGEGVIVLPDGVEAQAGTHRVEDGAVVPIT